MSTLARRLNQLERRLGRCPGCARTTIELVRRGAPARTTKPEFCHICGQPLERITLLVAFDPDPGAGP